MALLRSEAVKLDVSFLVRGVVKHIINRWDLSGEFEMFDAPEGDNVEWNRQNTIGSATSVDPNEDLSGVETAATFTNTTRQLRILGREVRVDNFIQQTQSKATSQMQQQLTAAVQAITERFLDLAIYGDNSVNSKEASGWHKLTDDANQGVNEAATALNLTSMETMLWVNAKKRDLRLHLVMNSQMIARFNAYIRKEAGAFVNFTPQTFGAPLEQYAGIPVHLTDFITMTETNADPPTKTGSTTTSIFLVGFGPVEQGGLAIGKIGEFVETTNFNQLETYDAKKVRLMMKNAWFDGSRYCLNRIRGITDAIVAA